MDQVHRPQYSVLIWGTALLGGMAALLRWPQESMDAMRSGLSLCGNVLLPSLFPFFVLSSLVVELGMARYLGKLLEPVMRPLFRLGGSCACALALGFVGGYPVGAKTTLELYQAGNCSRTEAQRLLSFCNNSGPAYVLGVVGAGVFNSSAIGFFLYLTHLLAAVLVGILFRFYRSDQPPSTSKSTWTIQTTSASLAFTRSVTGALSSCLNICAFVLFFTVILRCLALSGWMDLLSTLLCTLFGWAGLTPLRASPLLTGLLEVSTGVSALTSTGDVYSGVVIAALLLGWGGVCVHCQVLSLLSGSDLSPRTYFAGKFFHALLSALLSALFLSRLPLPETAASCLFPPEPVISADFSPFLPFSALCALPLWLVFGGYTIYLRKKSSRKVRRHQV